MEAIQNQMKQAAQVQQQQMQMQNAEIQSRIKLQEARAKADEGLGYERLSRVEENKALAIEREAAAERYYDYK